MTTNFTVEFLLWMLIAASLIAVLSARLRIPYTVALVIGGLTLGSIHLPFVEPLLMHRPSWLTPDASLVIFLPPLLFEGSLKIQVRHLRENLLPITLLATLGVLIATLIAGFAVHWGVGLSLSAALVFGAIVSATDPISVLAIFKDMAVAKRLTIVVEGESLFNDGTAAVLYAVITAGIAAGSISVWSGIQGFLIEVLGGTGVGLVLGYVFSIITQRIDEARIEITLTTILAYSAYMVAEYLHLSGVIATVAAGLMIGNFGARVGMSPRTRVALWSFWEYMSFVINSIVFLLIGLQVRITDLLHSWQTTLLAIGAAFLGRVFTVYTLTPVSNLWSTDIPLRWQHVLIWGGMRGALSLALALSLGPYFPHRSEILNMTFGVVAFTIIFQGLTIKPLLHVLKLGTAREDEYERARARRIAITSSRTELDELLRANLVSPPVYERLRHELEAGLEDTEKVIADLYNKDESRAMQETRMARTRLIAAEKSSIEQALHDGLISSQTAMEMMDDADKRLDQLANKSD
jgi:CPA1 family monovalent cation:H+ antiporter